MIDQTGTRGVKGKPLSDDDLRDKILKRISVGHPDECWPWQGPVDKGGYARQGARYVHRLVFRWHYGYGPEIVDHTCRTRHCLNPKHLQSVTRAENTRLGTTRNPKNVEFCSNGHPWEEGNLYVSPSGGRKCRTCRRIGMRKTVI